MFVLGPNGRGWFIVILRTGRWGSRLASSSGGGGLLGGSMLVSG